MSAAQRDITRNEQNFLGCLLRSPHDWWQVQDIVAPDMLTTIPHRDILGAIRDISDRGGVVSTAALQAHLPEEYDDFGPTIGIIETLKLNAAEAGSATDYAPTIAERAAKARLKQLAEWLNKKAKDDDVSAEDAATQAAAALQEIMSSAAPIRSVKLSEATDRVIQASLKTIETGILPGFDTGLPMLDEMVGLLMGGDFIAIMAALADGKSALIKQLCERIAVSGPVLCCHNEMGEEQNAVRAISGASGFTVREIREGAIDFHGMEIIRQAQTGIEKQPIYLYCNPRMTLKAVKAQALRLQRTVGLKALAIDGAKRLRPDGRYKDQWERKEEITGALKELALELNVPLLAAFQRTRFARRREDPVPHLDDAEFPSLEHDADTIIGLWREESWLMMNRPPAKAGGEAADEWEAKVRRAKGTAKIIGLKLRSGQPFQTRDFKWNGGLTRLESM